MTFSLPLHVRRRNVEQAGKYVWHMGVTSTLCDLFIVINEHCLLTNKQLQCMKTVHPVCTCQCSSSSSLLQEASLQVHSARQRSVWLMFTYF